MTLTSLWLKANVTYSTEQVDIISVPGGFSFGSMSRAKDGVVISDDTADGSYASTTSTVVVVSKSEEALEAFREMEGFRELGDSGRQRAWTDDYSDVLGPFKSKLGRKD